MGKMIILGTGAALVEVGRHHTHFALEQGERLVLVDCADNPGRRLKEAQIDPARVTDIILTHFHPDHVSGFGLFLMELWLAGRKAPLNVFGLEETLACAQQVMKFYGWERWPNFYPLHFVSLPAAEGALVLETSDLRIVSSPVRHLMPTIGLRAEFARARVIAYSCDTEPCDEVVRLAQGADILFHEAAGAFVGHSSPAQAAEIARQAGVAQLTLIHYPLSRSVAEMLGETVGIYSGKVETAEELAVYSL